MRKLTEEEIWEREKTEFRIKQAYRQGLSTGFGVGIVVMAGLMILLNAISFLIS